MPVARKRARFTGRMAIFTLVLLVLAMSFASSVKAYFDQRANIEAVQSDINSRQAEIDDLKAQIARWDDPAYQQQQARLRFGYVPAGETSYTAVDASGKPIEPSSSLTDPDEVGQPIEKDPWWTGAWTSVEVAGDPPKVTTPKALADTRPITVDPAQQGDSE